LQEECWHDCEKTNTTSFVLRCLLDCDHIHECVPSLVVDLIITGPCNENWAEFFNLEHNDECQYDGDGTSILKGSCSAKTEALLKDKSCVQAIFEQPSYIWGPLYTLINASCTVDVTNAYNSTWSKEGGTLNRETNFPNPRIPPVEVVNDRESWPYTTVLNFEHTRNRYPWVCSLRSTGVSPKHLCAVTLLSIPPQPTVVVGPAHCTYLCKRNKRNPVPVPSCCCASGLSESCKDDKNKCGDNPNVFLMTPDDADIICGEWNTADIPEDQSGETNVRLPIQKIVRHPGFQTKKGGGPIKGNDIAIFKVDDSFIANRSRSLKLRPACLPLQKRTTRATRGIHTGWSSPPPYHILEKYAPPYLYSYTDFSKQWHLSMDIMERCEDPQTYRTTNPIPNTDIKIGGGALAVLALGPVGFAVIGGGALLAYDTTTENLPNPSNTSYPAGTFCAKESSRTSCFSQGDSGSPLMVREETRPQRFVVEGILSFVKGCERFLLSVSVDETRAFMKQYSNLPTAYTKLSCFLPWIASEHNLDYEQGEPETQCVQAAGDPDDKDKSPCKTDFNTTCIFPFFYNDQKYTECVLITIFDWVYLPRCPVRDITTKKDGINSFTDADILFGISSKLSADGDSVLGYCPTNASDPMSPLDPGKDCEPEQRVRP
jgi:hypothetical protein